MPGSCVCNYDALLSMLINCQQQNSDYKKYEKLELFFFTSVILILTLITSDLDTAMNDCDCILIHMDNF